MQAEGALPVIHGEAARAKAALDALAK